MAEIKQFNFKISATLLEQLRRTAVAKDTTATDLIIQGIHQVLGITPSPKPDDIEFGIYKKLDELEQRFLDLEGYQSTVDLDLAKQIEDIRERITAMENFATNTVADIARSIYREIENEKTMQVHDDIDTSINIKLEQTNTEEPPLGVTNIAPNTNRGTNISPKKGQLTLPLDQDNRETQSSVRTVNASELIKILQRVDPSRGWNSDKLRSLRRSKKSRENQHIIGNYKFQYAGENPEGSRDTKHLWLLTSIRRERLKN